MHYLCVYELIMKRVILVKRLCWSYTISAGGGIASELIASLQEKEVKGK